MNIKIPKWLIIVSFIFLIFLAFLMYLRYIGTSGLVVKEYKVVNKNITENYHGLKIVQLSDIHYKTTINNKNLLKIVDKINYINPDIVVFTGDLFDNKIKYSDNDLKDLKNALSKIKGNDLFISGGLGCSLLNLRFFNHPSINLYRIVNK